jgi:hypothetical protein
MPVQHIENRKKIDKAIKRTLQIKTWLDSHSGGDDCGFDCGGGYDERLFGPVGARGFEYRGLFL